MDLVWRDYERAARAIEAFDRELGAFTVPGVLGSLFARLDAVHSSGAEGSTTTFTDLLEFGATGQAADLDDALGVAAIAETFDVLAVGGGEALPADAVLLIHGRLFRNVRDPHMAAAAGRWKVHPNGTFDSECPGGIFHYTSPAATVEAVGEWQAFSLERDEHPELIRQALSHWMFEHIHPVPDGNGRVGRLMVPLLMRRKGALRHACAFLGEAVHRNKDVYVSGLKDGRHSGDLAAWTRVFCFLAGQTARSNLDRLAGLRRVHERWLEATAGFRSHSVIHRLVPYALTHPVFTVRDAEAYLGGATFTAVNHAVRKMADLGLVTPRAAVRGQRVFAAPEVLGLFEAVRPA